MVFALVDTDMQFGHRRDVPGFARSLEEFDQKLPEIMKLLGRGADQNESLRWEGRSAEGKGKRGHVPGHLLVVGFGQKSRGIEPSMRMQGGVGKGGSTGRAEPSCHIRQFLIEFSVQ